MRCWVYCRRCLLCTGRAAMNYNDAGIAHEADSSNDGVILMHHPSSLFQIVLDLLRTASTEAFGEGEA